MGSRPCAPPSRAGPPTARASRVRYPALVVAYPEQRPGPDPFPNGLDIDPPANQSADPQPESERVGKTWSKQERKRDQEPPPPEPPPVEPPDEPPGRDPDGPVLLADFRSYMLKRATYIYMATVSCGPTAASTRGFHPFRSWMRTASRYSMPRASRSNVGCGLARSAPGRRTDDLGARRAEADQGPADRPRRMDRAPRLHRVQPVPPADASSRARATSAVARPRAQGLSRTRPSTSSSGWRIASSGRTRRSTTRSCSAASRASARTQSWSRSSTRSGRGISSKCRRQALLGRFNGFVQVGDPADQRGARPRRCRPFCLL